MTRITLLFSLFFIISLLSCTKDIDEHIVEVQIIENADELYFLDGVQVDFKAVENDDASLFIGITKLEMESQDSDITVINAFTTKKAYIAWGEENNFPVAMSLEVEEHLRDYAEQSGTIEIYERTGVIPQAFLDYQNNYLAQIKASYGISESTNRAPTLVRNTCGQVSDYFFLNLAPALPSAHNNRISAIIHISGFVGTTVYDRTFFRRNLGTFWEFGGNEHCFNTGYLMIYNNRMSSCITYS